MLRHQNQASEMIETDCSLVVAKIEQWIEAYVADAWVEVTEEADASANSSLVAADVEVKAVADQMEKQVADAVEAKVWDDVVVMASFDVVEKALNSHSFASDAVVAAAVVVD